tara:strand:- start:48 stop:236 length:189 start_codon:yes stop_codon:yes gene_type:complete
MLIKDRTISGEYVGEFIQAVRDGYKVTIILTDNLMTVENPNYAGKVDPDGYLVLQLADTVEE